MWEILALVSALFLVGGFFILRDKGITFRKWIFISLLAVLFMMMAAYGSQLLIDAYYPSVDYYVPDLYEEQSFVQGLTEMAFGVTGIILLTLFRKTQTEELSIAFGLAGSVLIVVGLIDMLRYEAAIAKFVVSFVGVIIVSFLIYKYHEFLLGE